MVSREELAARVEAEQAEWRRAEHMDAAANAVNGLTTFGTAAALVLGGPLTVKAGAAIGAKHLAGGIATHLTGLHAEQEQTEYKAATQALHHADAVGVALADHQEVAATPANLPKANGHSKITIT